MAPLPIISGDECMAALKKLGYEVARQEGSHVRLTCPGRPPVTVPRHGSLKRGTLKSILRTVGLSTDEFLLALR